MQSQKKSPGRKFALTVLKLIVAKLLIDYEFKQLKERPKDQNLGNYLVPDFKTTVSFRSRHEFAHQSTRDGK
jgi:hypothetical protein